jgi:hypothetical protein
MFSSWLHPQRGYEDAEDQLNKYYGQAQNYFNQGQQALQPYNQHGQDAYNPYFGAGNNLLNPEKMENQWASGYEESPYAKNLESEATQNGLNAASSMGIMGSSSALNAIQRGTSEIGAQQRQQYLNDLMQKYMSGAGIMGGIYGVGANAAGAQAQGANNMSNNAMNQGQNMAQMAYGAGNAQGNLFGSILNNGLGLVGSALGGGWNTSANNAPVSTASYAQGGGYY